MKKFAIVLACLLSVVSMSASALPLNLKKPKACPSVTNIINEGLAFSTKFDDNNYIAAQLSLYQTPQVWGFVVLIPATAASDEDVALDLAKQALPMTTSITDTPVYLEEEKTSYCLYSANEFQAAAITPVPMGRALNKSLFLKK